MVDQSKTKAQLIEEIASLRELVQESEVASLDTVPSRQLLAAFRSLKKGTIPEHLPADQIGIAGELAEALNDTLELFGDLVSELARIGVVVGKEGRTSQRAQLPAAQGVWRDLTDNVNELAANLTTQVRAISEVAAAVTEGDLSQEITVEALGEVAELKDTVNEMIRNLRETTRINTEQDWLKTNLTRFNRLQQILRNLLSNAFKFTGQGQVSLELKAVQSGWGKDCEALNEADFMVAFSVSDTGIGILTGRPVHVATGELRTLADLFEEEE